MTAQTILDGPDAVRAAVGSHLGFSDWLLMEQDRVDEVIKEWLRGRNRRALRRDKKVRQLAICFFLFFVI